MAERGKKGSLRAPIVTVLGHVDHGKTTLLDKIRESNVAVREAGGITQKIGASVYTTSEGREITFIDTPGHAAFSQMRKRGAGMADICILVVAADDGVKPQTREAIEYIKKSGAAMIVALTKIDLETANVEAALGSIEKEGIYLEKRGGDVPYVLVSGKTGEGAKELVELILLVSDLLEVSGDEKGELAAWVIETSREKAGCSVSVVVKQGVLRVGDEIEAEGLSAKVRGLFDWKGKSVKRVLPGEPALVLGFSQLPAVGARVVGFSGGMQAKEEKWGRGDIEIGEEQVGVVLKANSAGCLEAILASVPEGCVIVSSGVGEVVEGDVFLAKSTGVEYILTFESRVSAGVKKLAEMEGVKIQTFSVIYELLDRMEELVSAKKKVILGKAKIITSFPFNNKRVAGGKVLAGKIGKGVGVTLVRGEKSLGMAKIVSLKKLKDDVDEVGEGEEFGVILSPQLDFESGDVIVSAQ